MIRQASLALALIPIALTACKQPKRAEHPSIVDVSIRRPWLPEGWSVEQVCAKSLTTLRKKENERKGFYFDHGGRATFMQQNEWWSMSDEEKRLLAYMLAHVAACTSSQRYSQVNVAIDFHLTGPIIGTGTVQLVPYWQGLPPDWQARLNRQWQEELNRRYPR